MTVLSRDGNAENNGEHVGCIEVHHAVVIRIDPRSYLLRHSLRGPTHKSLQFRIQLHSLNVIQRSLRAMWPLVAIIPRTRRSERSIPTNTAHQFTMSLNDMHREDEDSDYSEHDTNVDDDDDQKDSDSSDDKCIVWDRLKEVAREDKETRDDYEHDQDALSTNMNAFQRALAVAGTEQLVTVCYGHDVGIYTSSGVPYTQNEESVSIANEDEDEDEEDEEEHDEEVIREQKHRAKVRSSISRIFHEESAVLSKAFSTDQFHPPLHFYVDMMENLRHLECSFSNTSVSIVGREEQIINIQTPMSWL